MLILQSASNADGTEGVVGGSGAWLGQGAVYGSEEGRVRVCDQDGETKAGLGGRLGQCQRSYDEH